MEIRIGIVNALSEVKLEMPDDTDAADVKAAIDAAVADNGSLVWLTDKRGRQTGFPVDRLAYIEIGLAHDDQRIGFS